jgi:hypothetical protein
VTLDEAEKLARKIELSAYHNDKYGEPSEAWLLARTLLAVLPVVRAAERIECEVCGYMQGGLNDLTCACEQPYVMLVYGLATLAHNLAIGGALCASYALGQDPPDIDRRWMRYWHPGCGRPAPIDGMRAGGMP